MMPSKRERPRPWKTQFSTRVLTLPLKRTPVMFTKRQRSMAVLSPSFVPSRLMPTPETLTAKPRSWTSSTRCLMLRSGPRMRPPVAVVLMMLWYIPAPRRRTRSRPLNRIVLLMMYVPGGKYTSA
jgi:hypothetical protein